MGQKIGPNFLDHARKKWAKTQGQAGKKWDNLATTSKHILMGPKKRGTKDINFHQANPQLGMYTFKVKTKTQQFGTFGKKKRIKRK